MRVLWIASRGGLYKQNAVTGTAGWVGALQNVLLETQKDLKLAIVFPHDTDETPLVEGNVTYYPVLNNYGKSSIHKLWNRYFSDIDNHHKMVVKIMVERIREFSPDVIHLWGIEEFYAEVLAIIKDIPIVVHIQGIVSACLFSYYPPGFSKEIVNRSSSWVQRVILRGGSPMLRTLFEKRANNEKRVAMLVENWIGRTDWDYTMSQILSPGSHYFHCDEMLRDDFLGEKWKYHYDGKTLRLQSNISEDLYKGFDVVLNVARILKEVKVNIQWDIYGWMPNSPLLPILIKVTGIKPEEVNVILHGRVDAKILKQALLQTDIYVHPSYIENSSNAIAEAMLLGVPIIAQNVGGNASMLKEDSGILVAPNEPFIMASKILSLRNKNIAKTYSQRALQVAIERQNRDKVVSDLMSIYEVLSQEKKDRL